MRHSRRYKDMLDQVDQALGLIGGRDGAIGWIGDTALVVNDAGGTLEGGIVIDPTDKAAAERLSTALQAVRRPRRRLAGHHRPRRVVQRDDDHDRRPRRRRRSCRAAG